MRRLLWVTACLGLLASVSGLRGDEGARGGLPASDAISSSQYPKPGDYAPIENFSGDAGGSPGGDDEDEGELCVEIREEISSVEKRIRDQADETDKWKDAVTDTSHVSGSTAEAGSAPELADGGDGGGDDDGSDDEDDDEEDEEEEEEEDAGEDAKGGDDDDDDDEDESGDGDDEEGDEKDAKEEGGEARNETHNHTASSNSTRTRRHGKEAFGERLGKLAFRHFNATLLPAAASLKNRTRILQRVPRKVWLPVALTAVAVALRKHISLQGISSFVMFVLFVLETIMRLGLFKSNRGMTGLTGLRDSQTPKFSFEYLNERYETDMMGLQVFLAGKDKASLGLPSMRQKIPQQIHKRDMPVRFPAYGSGASNTGPASAPDAVQSSSPSSSPQGPTGNATNNNVTSTDTQPTAAPTVAEVLAQNASARLNVTVQTPPASKPRCFVAKITGDTMFSMGPFLSSLVNFLLTAVQPEDEVVLLIESPGGAAHEYGLASAQLERLRRHNIRLTICVDKVAASGGYMMACVAERLIAAPFALVGSIGVITSIPLLNVADLLGKWGIKAYTPKAGKHKGQGSLLTGDVKESLQAVQKMQEDMDRMQGFFKRHVAKYRKALDIDQVATGEVWIGSEALTLGLVDDVMTSEEYLASRMPNMQVVHVKQHEGGSSLFSILGGRRRRSPIPSLGAARSLFSLLSDGIRQLGGKGSMPVPYMASWGL